MWSKISVVSKRESTGLECLNDSKAFMEYSNEADDVYKIIEEYVIQIRNGKY